MYCTTSERRDPVGSGGPLRERGRGARAPDAVHDRPDGLRGGRGEGVLRHGCRAALPRPQRLRSLVLHGHELPGEARRARRARRPRRLRPLARRGLLSRQTPARTVRTSCASLFSLLSGLVP